MIFMTLAYSFLRPAGPTRIQPSSKARGDHRAHHQRPVGRGEPSYTEARAFRDGFEIAVSIYVEPNRVIRDRRLAFPGADPEGVVIEFSVV